MAVGDDAGIDLWRIEGRPHQPGSRPVIYGMALYRWVAKLMPAAKPVRLIVGGIQWPAEPRCRPQSLFNNVRLNHFRCQRHLGDHVGVGAG